MVKTSFRLSTPMVQALWSTVAMAIFGILYRFIGGAIDPESRTWSLVLVAPFAGLVQYLQMTARHAMLAVIFFSLGVGATIFWTALVARGEFPLAGPGDIASMIVIFAFPLGCCGIGWLQWRKSRIATPPHVQP